MGKNKTVVVGFELNARPDALIIREQDLPEEDLHKLERALGLSIPLKCDECERVFLSDRDYERIYSYEYEDGTVLAYRCAECYLKRRRNLPDHEIDSKRR